jgi:LysM repeat protein
MNAIRAADLPVNGSQAPAASRARTSTAGRGDAQVIALSDYRATTRPDHAAGAATIRRAGNRRVDNRRVDNRRVDNRRVDNRRVAARLRLTRRGRFVVAAAAALLATALSLVAAVAAQATSRAFPPSTSGQHVTLVTVRPGDSLWSVAERADPGADPSLVVQQIIRLNRLSGDTVLAGEQLWAPRG